MDAHDREKLDRMCHPKGLAVFGGVTKLGSFANSVFLSLVKYGYPGRLYPVSSSDGEVAGIKAIKKLADADGPVDLASICVPASAVAQVLEDCLAHGVAGVQIHTAGFAETGEPKGRALQKELEGFAAKGLGIIGPNCFGIHCPAGGITVLPGFDFEEKSGPLAMISQSGGIANDFGHEAGLAGIGISKVISFGNGCDLDAVKLLQYLEKDTETKYIAAYIEGVADGRAFLDQLKKTTQKKPVVIWKGGLTPLGSRATLSHTGSLGGEARIWNGALKQAGAYPVQGLDEMMDTIMALAYIKSRGRRVALVGGGGAIGVFSSDLAHRWGLEMPVFGDQTQDRLKKWFPAPGNSVKNPLDTGTPALPAETLKACVEEILVSEPVDVLILMLLTHPLEVVLPTFVQMCGFDPPPEGVYVKDLLETLISLKKRTGKDVVVVFENRAYRILDIKADKAWRILRKKYQAVGISVFTSAERALRGIKNASVSGG